MLFLVLLILPVQAQQGRNSSGPIPPDASLWWSFRKPVLPRIPAIRDNGWVRNPIDAFVLARLESRGIKPAPQADRRTLIRRAYFDLIGLPPAPERVEKFVNDLDPNAYEKLVDELLASPRYGERWGRHWLDVARYADTGGYETDIYYKNAWRYRDYVIQSFNADKPYDRFVQEQIAGDEIWPTDFALEGSYNMPEAKKRAMEARIGTSLYSLYPQVHESNMDGKKIGYERLTDWVDTTASVFMGLTLGCARCHDHKFDPLTQRDYYSMQALFAASKEVEVSLVHAMAIASSKQHYPTLVAVDEARRAYRLFEERVKKKGGILSAEDAEEKKRLLERIANSVLAIPESIPDAPGGSWEGLLEVPTATVLGHQERALIHPVYLLRRGDIANPGEKMAPGVPAVLREATGVTDSFVDGFTNRKKLALWLTRPDHPLTARVIVNRVWQWHFGRGIVSTPNDFGKMGQRPTHPELLDWLAAVFVEGERGRRGEREKRLTSQIARTPELPNARHSSPTLPISPSPPLGCAWSLKKLHRLIMLSSTYQMVSAYQDATASRIDPENKFLWRMNRRRLEAEALWDTVHAIAGTLNLKMGGRPVVPPLAEEEMAALRERFTWPVSADPAEHNRRGIYILTRRNFRFPMFEVFDAPVNSVSCPCRDVTTVAPQALWLLNNRTMMKQAQSVANRLIAESSRGPNSSSIQIADYVDRAWKLAFARPPSDTERREAVDLIKRLAKSESTGKQSDHTTAQTAALTKFCLTLFNLNEFDFID